MSNAETPAPVQGLALYLGRALVDDPEPVEVAYDGDDQEGTFRLKVGPDDLGKVIGKKGRTAKALRTLISAAGAKQDLRLSLEIVEPDREERQAQKEAARQAREEQKDASDGGSEDASDDVSDDVSDEAKPSESKESTETDG